LNHQYLQPILINPAATGFQGDHQVLAGYRSTWSAFPDAPRTFTALYNGSFADKIGLGVQLLTDRFGAGQLFHGQINYAYRFNLDNVKLSVGLSTGLQSFRIKGTSEDGLIDPSDPLLAAAVDGYLLFDGGIGVYGEADQKLFFGISFPHLVKNRISEIEGDIHLADLDRFSYAVLLGYRFHVQSHNFMVEPSITVRDFRYSPFLVDLNLKLSFLDEQLVGGVGYSIGGQNGGGASLLLGTRIDALRLFYSYGVGLGDFQRFNNGSHELTFVYRVKSYNRE